MKIQAMFFALYLYFPVLMIFLSTGTSLTNFSQTTGSPLDSGLTYGLVRQLLDDYNGLKQNYEISNQKVSVLEQEVASIHQTLGKDITNLRNTSAQRYLITEKELRTLKQEIVQLKQYNVTAEKEIQDLKQNNLLLKRENEKLKNISSLVDGLQKEFRYISLSFLDVSKKTSNVSTALELFQTNISAFTANLQHQTTNISRQFDDSTKKVQDQVHSLELFQSNITSQIASMRNRVAFTAVMTSPVSSGLSVSTLVFPKVIFNAGNGYNPGTGIFTAPVTGDYVFYVAAVSYSNKSLYLDIAVNGQSKVRSLGSMEGKFQTGTNLVVYRLQKGDRVWVNRYSGSGYWTYSSAPTTTFSGFLLQ